MFLRCKDGPLSAASWMDLLKFISLELNLALVLLSCLIYIIQKLATPREIVRSKLFNGSFRNWEDLRSPGYSLSLLTNWKLRPSIHCSEPCKTHSPLHKKDSFLSQNGLSTHIKATFCNWRCFYDWPQFHTDWTPIPWNGSAGVLDSWIILSSPNTKQQDQLSLGS